MSEKTYQAAKYIRLSYTDDKTVESDSVQNQRKLIDSYIESQPDIEAIEEKVDDGVSGIIFDRKAFKEMMADIESGKINCVIVKDLSRLGREYIETGRYLRRIFPAYGVRFIAINDNIDTLRDSGDDLVVSVKSIINDAYCRDISIKIRSALNIKRENGDFVGSCPIYGYRKANDNHNQLVIDEYAANVVRDIFRMKINGMSTLKIAETLNSLGYLSPIAYKKDRGLPHPKGGYTDKGCLFGYILDSRRKMVIDEPAADTVRHIYSLALEGCSLAQIAKRLYDEKRPTPSKHKGYQKNNGCAWTLSGIREILRDEQYTGTYIAGRTKTLDVGSSEIIKQPESEWYMIPDHHPVIVEKMLFDAVRTIINKNGEVKRKRDVGTWQRYRNIGSPLKGKVVCGCCNHVMQLSSTRNARFQCRFSRVASDAECHRLSISGQELADMLYDVISKQVQVILNIKSIGEISNLDIKVARQTEIEKQIEMYQDEKRRLYEGLVLGAISTETYKMAKTSIDAELVNLNRINADLIAENEKLSIAKEANDELLRVAESASGEDTLTRQLVDMLVLKVCVYPGDKVEVVWKISGFINEEEKICHVR